MRYSLILGMITFTMVSTADGAEENPANPQLLLETSKGKIVIALFPDKAPMTVKNFLDYVTSGFYDGTIFHRVILDFMIQGGGFTERMEEKETKGPIKNEADNGLRNRRGTIAMARLPDPDSATSQFFINTVNNRSLDHKGKSPERFGYAVFGKVIEGMEVVDAISKVRTGIRKRMADVPLEPVLIHKASLVGGKGD
jgi:cyclophilin family peptidyl-prolyl cis-trans isomerase